MLVKLQQKRQKFRHLMRRCTASLMSIFTRWNIKQLLIQSIYTHSCNEQVKVTLILELVVIKSTTNREIQCWIDQSTVVQNMKILQVDFCSTELQSQKCSNRVIQPIFLPCILVVVEVLCQCLVLFALLIISSQGASVPTTITLQAVTLWTKMEQEYLLRPDSSYYDHCDFLSSMEQIIHIRGYTYLVKRYTC